MDFHLPEAERAELATQYRFDQEKDAAEPCGQGCVYMFGSRYASGGAGCVSTVEDFIKFLEALRFDGKLLKKETIEMMSKDWLNEEQRAACRYSTNSIGYGLGVRAPRAGADRTEFGWGGAAGAFASVDPVNNMSIYYAQHVLSSPNNSLRTWLYHTVRADLLGEKVHIPNVELNYDSSITY